MAAWPTGRRIDGSTKSRTVPIAEKWWRYCSAGSARRGALCLPSRGWHGTGTARVPAHASRPPDEPRRRAFHRGARRRRAELPYAADGISCQLR